ncbi:MAG TPA: GAF domain-containing protein, partial [Solirubrobacteraceae bacterium]|nr:GAF domain-containing protein [Solirubrobacteraceae bacterium]
MYDLLLGNRNFDVMRLLDPFRSTSISSRHLSDRSRPNLWEGVPMQCPRCRHANPSDANFCMQCGTPLIRRYESDTPRPSYQDQERALGEALEQQKATAEILRVISSSPTDVLPAFKAIATAATRLCAAQDSGVIRFDGVLMHLVANDGFTAEEREVIRAQFPRSANRGMVTGRAIVTRAVEHVADITRDPEYDAIGLQHSRFMRAVLSVPMLHNGQPVGVITVTRREAQPFSGSQIALLETFADQAVIAIENVRLFKELQARTAELIRSVGELTALGEISQVLSSTLDLETVLTTIVSRAVQLSGVDGGVVFEYD